jgi:hypothetical protein
MHAGNRYRYYFKASCIIHHMILYFCKVSKKA